MEILTAIQATTELKQQTSSEFAGPCPQCGGEDRFRVWPESGRYWCRQCGWKGDLIDFIQWRDKVGFTAAKQLIGDVVSLTGNRQRQPARQNKPYREQKAEPPTTWKSIAARFIKYAQRNLFRNSQALEWLSTNRGIEQPTAERLRLGWNPKDIFCKSLTWGIEDNRKLFLPAGHVIPRFNQAGQAMSLRVRVAQSQYHIIKGSQTGWSQYGTTNTESIIILVESDLDAILLHQIIGAPCFAATSAYLLPNKQQFDQIRNCRLFIDCLDADKAGQWIGERIKAYLSNYTRAPIPGGKDPGEAWKNGVDFHSWFKQFA